MKASENGRRRGLRSWSATRRILTAAIIVGLLGATLASPAGATSPPPAGTSKYSAMAASMDSIIGPAPASFPQQLKTYLQTVATSKSYAGLPGAAQLPSKAATASTLIAKADPHDLAVLYYVISQVPNWQQETSTLRTAARDWRAMKTWQRDTRLRPQDITSDCPDQHAHIAEVIVADAAAQIFELVDLQIADSDLVTVLGEGITIPVSPYKIITQVVKEVINVAFEALYGTYGAFVDCAETMHERQHDQLSQFVNKMDQQKTLSIHVTDIDTYHYQFSVQFEGQPVDPTNETLFRLYQQSGYGVLTPSDITSQVSFQRLDTGLYQFTIPTSQIGSAYRLKIEYDNGQDIDGNTLAYYGDTVFTKISQ